MATQTLEDLSTVIIAGGKGTRLGLTDLPKPMAPLLGKPILEYQIELLARSGIRQVFILAGHLAHKITEYFGDGQRFGLQIDYCIEAQPLGTAGALNQLAGRLDRDFLVLYGDVFVDLDLRRLVAWHRQTPSLGTLVVHPNDHPQDSDLVDTDDQGRVQAFLSKPHPEGQDFKNLVNAALYVLAPGIFPFIPQGRSSDFGKDVFPAVVAAGQNLRAYSTPEYLKDMGTPERLASVGQAFQSGKTARRNLANRQRAIFLDRDGIINVEKDGILKPQDLELMPDIVSALKAIHQTDFLAVVVTNQPFIAKGQMTYADLAAVHKRLDTLLGRAGTFVDALFFCPHHPEKGWPGEVPELKIDCDCRKPKPGLLLQAAAALNIDLAQSYILGDRLHDTLAGVRAGCRGSLLIGPAEASDPTALTHRFATTLEAVTAILEGTV